jgi:hypothetical protein
MSVALLPFREHQANIDAQTVYIDTYGFDIHSRTTNYGIEIWDHSNIAITENTFWKSEDDAPCC